MPPRRQSAPARPARGVTPAGAASGGRVVRPAQERGLTRPALPSCRWRRRRGRTIALIGPLADSATDMLGCWSAQGIPNDVITLQSRAGASGRAAERHEPSLRRGFEDPGQRPVGFRRGRTRGPQGRRGDPRPRRARAIEPARPPRAPTWISTASNRSCSRQSTPRASRSSSCCSAAAR